MSTYRNWNNALWKYFFPNGNKDAILYLDDNILSIIAERERLNCDEPTSNDFLRKTLINSDGLLRQFRNDFGDWTGERRIPGVDRWDNLVDFLLNTREKIGGAPAYFAMLCAIMYLASAQGADHTKMKTLANNYLGEGYKGKVGELVDDLMKQLHKDQNSFNPDRMVCGTQRHMSRIKYHLVLKSKERQDFIDFLEVGNLQWNEGSYADYANNILIPALHRANKQALIDVVKSPEFFPYVKNILLSNLNWGKDPSTSELGNTRQIKDVKWRYEMELDYDGNPHFYISTDYDLSFGVRLNNNGFEIIDEISDYIAFDVQFKELETAIVEHNGYEYCLSNLSQNDNGDWNKEIFFQQVGDRYYHQVPTPLEGKHYVKFIKTRTQGIGRLTDGWTQSQIGLEGYEAYMIDSYTTPTRRTRQTNNNLVDDKFKFHGFGTWFGILLKEEQHIYWDPDLVGNDGAEIKSLIQAPNGKTYFRLPRNKDEFVRGNLKVKDNRGVVILPEQIKDDFLWDGLQTKYGYNEWGEVIESGSIPRASTKPNAHHKLRDSQNAPFSQDSNMLIQILYDIADEKGCVSSKKLVDAINFVLDFYNIIPTKKNQQSLIYALRRLGYIVAYYDVEKKDYVNQMVSPYIERTNYSFVVGGQNNAYLVKGVYSKESLQTIINNSDQVKYKRPYTDDLLHQHPEYVCLPDFVLFTKRNEQNIDGWDVVEYPVAYDYLSAIADMKDFESHFNIVGNGDVFMTQHKLDVPCMVNEKGKDELCVMDSRGHYTLRQSYSGTDGVYRNIPRQLSRVYCQNKHEKPIVILKTYRANKETVIDSNLVTILHQMGKPELLDIALCDLNLGLPKNNRCFVVDNPTSGLPSNEKDLYSYGDTYDTANSVEQEQVRQGLEKIGARQINDYFNSSSVFLSPRQLGYSMIIITPSEGKICMALYEDSNMVAFSIGSQKVYVSDHRGNFKEILGDSTLNSKLSAVINNIHVDCGNIFPGTLPDFNEAKEVEIIKKHQ
jgi:hypothetical protein